MNRVLTPSHPLKQIVTLNMAQLLQYLLCLVKFPLTLAGIFFLYLVSCLGKRCVDENCEVAFPKMIPSFHLYSQVQ